MFPSHVGVCPCTWMKSEKDIVWDDVVRVTRHITGEVVEVNRPEDKGSSIRAPTTTIEV